MRGLALQAAAPTAVLADRDVLLAAVARDGRALKYASANLQGDRAIVARVPF